MLTNTQKIFKKRLTCLGGSVPFDRNARNDVLEQLYKNEEFDDFDEIDDFYYGEECINQLMNEYVKLHAADFVVKGDYPYYEF